VSPGTWTHTFQPIFFGDDLENILGFLQEDSCHSHVGGALGLCDCKGENHYSAGTATASQPEGWELASSELAEEEDMHPKGGEVTFKTLGESDI
jgi:hypothetical protein